MTPSDVAWSKGRSNCLPELLHACDSRGKQLGLGTWAMAQPEGRANVWHSPSVFRRGSTEASILHGKVCLTSNKCNIEEGNANSEWGASLCLVLSH